MEDMIRPILYFASPLFNKQELEFNRILTVMLEKYFSVYLPQRDGGLMDKFIQDGMSIQEAEEKVFNGDVEALLKCNAILTVLDGRTIDEGVAFELGFAYANKKLCIGLQTDIRRLLPYGNNPMIQASLDYTFNTVEDLIFWVKSVDIHKIITEVKNKTKNEIL